MPLQRTAAGRCGCNRCARSVLRSSSATEDGWPPSLSRYASSSIMKKMTAKILFVTCIVFACGRLSAQTNVWQPSPGHTQVPVWPGAVPDAQAVPGPEAVLSNTDWAVAGKPFAFVVNVSQPTMTGYSPKRTNTGLAGV